MAVFLETSKAQYRPCSTELAKPLWPFSITMTLLALFADPELYPRICEKSQIPSAPQTVEKENRYSQDHPVAA